MQLRILCAHTETSSLWAKFVNKNRCISVFVYYPNRLKALNSLLWPEYFIDFLCEIWIPCQAVTSILCLHYRPETVHCSTKDAYTYEITFLALHPWNESQHRPKYILKRIWNKSTLKVSILLLLRIQCRFLSVRLSVC